MPPDRPLRLCDLTEAEITALGNGCGPKGFRAMVPDFVWTHSCDRHDALYWIGGGPIARLRADLVLLMLMAADVFAELPLVRWPGGLLLSWVYFVAVRRGGFCAFHYGRARRRADLDRHLAFLAEIDRG